MAQNFLEQPKSVFNFSPGERPLSMPDYNLKELSHLQQKDIFEFKIKTLRDNHTYLKNHPEIRTLVSLLLNAALKGRPDKQRIPEFFADFFISNFSKIESLLKRPPIKDDEEEDLEITDKVGGSMSAKEGVYKFDVPKTVEVDTVVEILSPERPKDTPDTSHKNPPTIIDYKKYSYEILNVLSN